MPELVANPPPIGSALSRSSPFPGLRPFEEQDASWFFGRSGEINDLLKRLRRLHFVAIVGASGSGKSSVIRAGVLPQIRDGYLDAEWLIAVFRPGERPVDNLAEAFVPAGSNELAEFSGTLRSSSIGLVRALHATQLANNRKVLILVDQFEELFQFAQRGGDSAQEEVKQFLKLLLAAASSDDIAAYVVITMRLEWLNECATYAGLAEAINEGIYLVPQMSRRQFQQTILGPLEAADGGITAALLDRMLNDLDAKSDQLPVLQHALMRIWDRKGVAGPFDTAAYESVGTFSNCLSAHAEEVFGELTGPQKKTAELLFRSITQVSKNRKIRRPRPIGEIVKSTGVSFAELETIIVAFSKPGRSFLVTTEGALQSESIVDISHEALIRQWARLSGWVESEAEVQSRIGRLEEDAAEWDRNRKGLKACLYRGGQLTRAEELEPKLDATSKALPFLKESVRARFWRLVWIRGSIALGLLLLVALATYLTRERYESAKKSLELARARQAQAEVEANLAGLQVKKAQAFQADLVQKIDAAKGDSTALAAIAQSIRAKRVYVQYVAGDLDTAKTVQAQLRKQGYAVPGTELVPNDKEPPSSQVRYFHPEDQKDASAVASVLRTMSISGVSVQAIADPKGVVPPGQFEVWLVPGANASQVQAYAKSVITTQAAPSAQAVETKPAVVAAVAPPPTIDASLSSEKVQQGQKVTLTWQSNASEVQIEGIGSVPPSGQITVGPSQTTSYKWTAKGEGGTSSKTLTVEVTPAPVAPPPLPALDPTAAIKSALTRYREAYESESLDELKQAWPSINKAQQKNIKLAFDQFNAIRMNINCRDEDIHIEGDAATANCRQVAVYTLKGKKQPEQTTSNTFKLRKQGSTWVVDAVQ